MKCTNNFDNVSKQSKQNLKFPVLENVLAFRSRLLQISTHVFLSSHRRCSIKKLFSKVLNIHRKTSVLECFPVNIAEFSRAAFLKSICEWRWGNQGIKEKNNLDFFSYFFWLLVLHISEKTFECINQCALQYAETRAEDKSDLLLPGFYKIRDLTWQHLRNFRG